MALPMGVVTFLFSDIEESTRHAQRLGDVAWAQLLRDHDRIVDGAVAAHRGTVVKHEGDGTFAVFPDATEAVAASVAITGALAAGALDGAGTAVRVRIGLHRGAGRLTEGGGDYVGIDVHFAARVAAAGNGGQIVISEAARAALGPLPEAAIVVDEGVRRLKDFDDPQPLYRIVVEGVSDDDRALRTEDLPSNLPSLATRFVGRGLRARPARRAAHGFPPADPYRSRRHGQDPDGRGTRRRGARPVPWGTWFVDLAPIRDPSLVVGTVAVAMGLREEPGVPVATTSRDHLRSTEALLVLDNLEQLLPDAAGTVATLLRDAPLLRLIVTSREVLRVGGELEYVVPPLAGAEGVELFLDRARSGRAWDAVDADLDTVRAIVDRLEGLPLAIELAAARTRMMAPAAILERLSGSLDVLAGGVRDLPERQRTLRGTVAWSHDLLDPEEQVIFRRSAVFNGGWTGEAAEAVVDPSRSLTVAVLDGLESLADKSLVRVEVTDHGEPRFGRHVLIREYALERLADAGERADCERRHAMTYLAIRRGGRPEAVGR